MADPVRYEFRPLGDWTGPVTTVRSYSRFKYCRRRGESAAETTARYLGETRDA